MYLEYSFKPSHDFYYDKILEALGLNFRFIFLLFCTILFDSILIVSLAHLEVASKCKPTSTRQDKGSRKLVPKDFHILLSTDIK